MKPKIYNFCTMAQVKQANRKNGRHWFNPKTMRFFLSTVKSKLLNGGYFITSEQLQTWNETQPRRYTIRQVADEQGSIKTVSDFQEFRTIEQARKNVKLLQAGLPIMNLENDNHKAELAHQGRDDMETFNNGLSLRP